MDTNLFVVAEGELPMIAAHRDGGDNNPENTIFAFCEAVNTISIILLKVTSI